MNTYKSCFSYNGSRYEGWQIQQHTDLTIQGQINKVLKKITKSEEIRTLGSGRTDSGVHAMAQVCKLSLPISIESGSLMKALNSQLPKDIRCTSLQSCHADFHPVRDAIWKQYDYIVYTGEILNPMLNSMVTHYSYPLDLGLVRKALSVLEGEKDFKNFSTKGTEVSSTIRTLHCAELIEGSGQSFEYLSLNESFLRFRFVGSGFLKQMVRLLVSAALESGRGKVMPREIEKFLNQNVETKIAPTAKPHGLYLSHVEYKDAWCPSIDKRLQSR